MQCIDDDTLGAYVDGALGAVDIAQVELHITDCAPCRQQLSALVAVHSVPAKRSAGAADADDDVALSDTIASTPSLDAFRRRLANAGVDETRLFVRPKGAVTTLAIGPGGARENDLPRLVGGDRCELALQDPIGRGGMALVLAARQIPLAREVAVKRAVPGGQDPREASADMIREAATVSPR